MRKAFTGQFFAAILFLQILVPAYGEVPEGVARNRRLALSNTPRQTSELSDLAVSGPNVFVAWLEQRSDGWREIRFRASEDGGAMFGDGPSGRILAAVPREERIFSIRTAANESDVYVLFTSGLTEGLARVSLVRSNDRGATFSRPVQVEGGPGGSPYADLAIGTDGVVFVAIEDRAGREDILLLRSTDRGESFGEAIAVARTDGRSLFPDIAARGTKVAIVWEEAARRGVSEVLLSRSNDGGASFTEAVALSHEGARAPSIASSDAIHLVWIEGNGIVYRRSEDGGRSFGDPQILATAGEGDRLRMPRVASHYGRTRVAWIEEDRNGVMRGPFLRRSGHDALFGEIEDLSSGLPGRAYGAAAVGAATRGVAAWPHTPSGLANDAEIVVTAVGDCTISWGGGNGLWGVAGNWRRNGAVSTTLPGATDDVCITEPGTVTLNGGRSVRSVLIGPAVAAGTPILFVQALAGNGHATLTVSESLLNEGQLVLDSIAGSAATSTVTVTGTLTNAPAGILRTGNAGPGPRVLNANVVSEGTFTVDGSTNFSKTGGTFTNHFDMTVGSGANVGCSSTCTINQEDGTISGNGTVTMSADTFNFNGGTMPVTVFIINGSTLNIASAATGTANFVLRSTNNFSGNVAEGQSILIEGRGGNAGAQLTAANGFTNMGTITLDTTVAPDNGNNVILAVTSGTLTNGSTGVIRTLSSVAGITSRLINADVTNQGTITLERNTQFNKASGVIVNEGTITAGAGVAVSLTSAGNMTFTQSGGSIGIVEPMTLTGDTYNFDGGTIDGTVRLTVSSTLNIGPGSTGAGDFVFRNGGNILTGDIAAAQSVLLEGLGSNATSVVTAPNGFTNFGTLLLDARGPSSDSASTGASLSVTNGTLTTRPGLTSTSWSRWPAAAPAPSPRTSSMKARSPSTRTRRSAKTTAPSRTTEPSGSPRAPPLPSPGTP